MLKFSSFTLRNGKRNPIPDSIGGGVFTIQVAGLKYYEPPKPVDKSEWPESRKLRMQEKQPDFSNVKAYKMPKMIQLMRGPEPVHRDLIYKGYGVKALLGGRLKHEHFETIRNLINKKLDLDRMFAIWRVDAPWQPCSKKGTGKRMGGGKGANHHYVTPVKADRIIVEIGGDLCDLEAWKLLGPVAQILPFPARVVSHDMLQKEKEKEEWEERNNLNQFTMEYAIKNNLGGCHKWCSKYDHMWFGKYR